MTLEDKNKPKCDDDTYIVEENQLDMFTGEVIGKKIERKVEPTWEDLIKKP